MFAPPLCYAFCGALVACYVAVFALYASRGAWLFDSDGAVNFVDFISFWVNARFAVTSAAATAYDHAAFAAAQAPYVATTRGALPYFHLVYPPTLFPLVAPLGLLSYAQAFAAWMVATAALYVVAIRRIAPRKGALLLALAPYAVPANLFVGQTGFLVAGLLGLSLSLMARRPFVAGLCLGMLTCKPQYGLIFPIVLLVSGQWRVVAGACVTIAALAFVVTGCYGMAIWEGYAHTLLASNVNSFMTDENLVSVDQTVFGLMQWLGAGFAVKWSVHLLAAMATAGLVCTIWRRSVSENLKAAALAIGALAVTPYILGYDLVALSVPVAFIAREGIATGVRPGERLALLGCFAGLFLMQQVPVGPVILAVLMVVVGRRVFPAMA